MPLSLAAGLALGQGALGGLNALIGGRSRRMEYKRQNARYNNFMNEIDSLGLQDPINIKGLDYGKAIQDASGMNAGLYRNAMSQVNRQLGGMNQASRAMGLPVNGQQAGHMIGGVYGNLGAQNARTVQGLLQVQQQQNNLDYRAALDNRRNSLQHLQMKHFGRPTKPDAGTGWVGFMNSALGAAGGYMAGQAQDQVMQGLADKFEFSYNSPYQQSLFGRRNKAVANSLDPFALYHGGAHPTIS